MYIFMFKTNQLILLIKIYIKSILKQYSKRKVEFTGPNQILEFIFI
jgi:hypothetical protein